MANEYGVATLGGRSLKVAPTPCRKCGGEDIAISYQSRGHYGCRPFSMPWDAEHLDFYCRRCGHRWPGPTLEQTMPGANTRMGVVSDVSKGDGNG